MTPEEIAAKEAADKAAADKAAADAAAKTPAKTPEELQADAEAATSRLAAIEAERDEAAAKLKEFTDADEARKAADLTETEREKAAREKAEGELATVNGRLRRREILDAAKAAGSTLKVDLEPTAIDDLYDAKAFDNIKLDDKTGKPIGVEALLKDLIRSKPYIAKVKPDAPDINATKTSAEKIAEMDAERKATLKKRFRM